MKRTATGYLYMSHEYLPDYSGKEWQPDIWSCKVDETESRIFVREMQIEVDIPEDWDPIPKQVAALERQKAEALAEYQQKVESINDRLSKLLAITYTPEAA